jgi:serine/threonine protein kinase
MGRGSSSDALLVRRDGNEDEAILKVACDIAHNDRLVAEGEVLARLHHQNIVAHRETLTVAGRTALLLKSAGARTLAEKIKDEGRLSLDMLQRFGEELMEAVNHLESEGVAHRDIKPENIGIAETALASCSSCCSTSRCAARRPTTSRPARTPTSIPSVDAPAAALGFVRRALCAGSHPVRNGGGPAPVWGDGHTSPAMLDVEASIESDASSIRSPAKASPPSFEGAKARLRKDSTTPKRCCAPGAIFTARQTVHPGKVGDSAADSGFGAIA